MPVAMIGQPQETALLCAPYEGEKNLSRSILEILKPRYSVGFFVAMPSLTQEGERASWGLEIGAGTLCCRFRRQFHHEPGRTG
jgi:hypothetical protein